VEPSDEEAVQWYQRAADQGHEKARFNLTSLRKATTLRDFNPDDEEINAAFDAAEAKAAENK
jgi:TPR repeat protein